MGFSWETKPNPFQQALFYLCGESYSEIPSKSLQRTSKDRYWWLRRFITIIVVISIVLIVRQEDPDKMQDAHGLLKSIGLQTPIYGQLG